MYQNHLEFLPPGLDFNLLNQIVNYPNDHIFTPNPHLPSETLQLMFSYLPKNTYVQANQTIEIEKLRQFISVFPSDLIFSLSLDFVLKYQSTLLTHLSPRIRLYINDVYPSQFLSNLPPNCQLLLGPNIFLNIKKIIPFLPLDSILISDQNTSSFQMTSLISALRSDQSFYIAPNYDMSSGKIVASPRFDNLASVASNTFSHNFFVAPNQFMPIDGPIVFPEAVDSSANTAAIASSSASIRSRPIITHEVSLAPEQFMPVNGRIIFAEQVTTAITSAPASAPRSKNTKVRDVVNNFASKSNQLMAETLISMRHTRNDLVEIAGLQLKPNTIGEANSLLLSIASSLMVDISFLKQSLIAYVHQHFIHYIDLFGALNFNRFLEALMQDVAKDLETIQVLVRFLQRDIVVLSAQSIRMYEYTEGLNVKGAPIYLMLDCFNTFHPYTITSSQPPAEIQQEVISRYNHLSISRSQIN